MLLTHVCPRCYGARTVSIMPPSWTPTPIRCPTCEGSGRIVDHYAAHLFWRTVAVVALIAHLLRLL